MNWKPLIKGSGYGTRTGIFYEVHQVSPYNFSGNANDFTYDSIGILKLKSAAGDVDVKYNFHASYSPVAGFVVRIDNYTVSCSK